MSLESVAIVAHILNPAWKPNNICDVYDAISNIIMRWLQCECCKEQPRLEVDVHMVPNQPVSVSAQLTIDWEPESLFEVIFLIGEVTARWLDEVTGDCFKISWGPEMR